MNMDWSDFRSWLSLIVSGLAFVKGAMGFLEEHDFIYNITKEGIQAYMPLPEHIPISGFQENI
jgi:hypothetical protein